MNATALGLSEQFQDGNVQRGKVLENLDFDRGGTDVKSYATIESELHVGFMKKCFCEIIHGDVDSIVERVIAQKIAADLAVLQ
jgi:hypothetical protein